MNVNYNRRVFLLMIQRRPEGWEQLCRSLLLHMGGMAGEW